MKEYAIHEDFALLNASMSMHPALIIPGQVIAKGMYRSYRCGKDIAHTRKKVPGYLSEEIEVGIYRPKGISGALPCIFLIHGGGFALAAGDYHREILCDYVRSAACVGIDIDYHLLPAYPWPAAFDDCKAVWRWIGENALSLGIDPSRIALCGDSAGGALVAGLTQYLRDSGATRPVFQALICPVLDSRMETESMRLYDDTPLWNAKSTRAMWDMYLEYDDPGPEAVYASPGTHPDVKELPPAYIEVSEFDCLRDEGIAYARRLEEAGVPVTLVETKGTIHAFELAKQSEYRNKLLDERREHIIGMFKEYI